MPGDEADHCVCRDEAILFSLYVDIQEAFSTLYKEQERQCKEEGKVTIGVRALNVGSS